MNENTFSNLTRSAVLKKVAIYGSIVVVVLLMVVFWLTNTVVFLNVTNNTGASVTTAAIVGEEIKPVGGSGLLVVPRSATGLVVSAGDKGLTQTSIEAPWYGFATKSVQIEAGKKADKVSFQGTEPICVTYAQTADKLLHYNCEKLDTLVSSETATDGKVTDKKLASLQYISGQNLPPYKSGVLGVAESTVLSGTKGDKKTLVRFTSANGVVSYEAPSQITTSNLKGLRLFTDASNPENGHFVLVDISGVIYLGTPSDDGRTASYKRVDAPSDYSDRFNQTFCSLKDETVYCYRGTREIEQDKDAVVAKPSISQLSFVDGEISTKSVEDVSLLDGFYTTDNSIYGKKGTALYVFEPASDKYVARQLAQYVERVIGGKNLYFVKSNGVHELDDKTHDSRRIFYSSDISVRGFYPAADKLFVFGQTRSSGSVVSAYQLK